jgi:hypothetical protein
MERWKRLLNPLNRRSNNHTVLPSIDVHNRFNRGTIGGLKLSAFGVGHWDQRNLHVIIEGDPN